MKKIIYSILFFFIASCSIKTNRNDEINSQNLGFTKNRNIINMVNSEMEGNCREKIIMLIFVTNHDSNYIFTTTTKDLPVPILKEGDDMDYKFKNFDLPFYRYKNSYIVFCSNKTDSLMGNFITMDSLIHKPMEIYNLRLRVEKEKSEKKNSRFYKAYYINKKDSIIYIGKRKGWW